MVNEVTIQVKVKPSKQVVSLTLSLKVYSKHDELQYVWRTPPGDYFLEIVQQEKNYIYNRDINKDLRIITSNEKIAEQMMEKMPVF